MISRSARPLFAPNTLYGLLVAIVLALFSTQNALAAKTVDLTEAEEALEADDFTTAAELLETLLVQNPEDEPARFLYARVLSWNDQRTEALAQYDRLLQISPDNVDYILGQARVLIWEGRLSEAIVSLEHARALSPDIQAVWQLEIQTLIDANDKELHKKASDLAEIAAQRFPDSIWDVPGWGAVPEHTRLVTGYSHEFLSDDFSDWQSVYVAGEHRFADRRVVYGAVRSTQRFDINDYDLTVGAYLPVGDRWMTMVEGSVGPGAEVLPRSAAMVQIQRSFKHGYGVQLSIRHNEYQTTYNDLIALGADRYWGNYHAAYTLYHARPEGDDPVYSHSLGLQRYYGEDNQIGLIYATGEEAESVGGGMLLVSDIETFAVSGRQWFKEHWAISWIASYHEQGNIYHKTGFDIGLWREF